MISNLLLSVLLTGSTQTGAEKAAHFGMAYATNHMCNAFAPTENKALKGTACAALVLAGLSAKEMVAKRGSRANVGAGMMGIGANLMVLYYEW